MNKFLMMSAAVFMTGSASAPATAASGWHTRTFVFGTSNGGSYCDGGIGRWNGFTYLWTHTNVDCSGKNYVGNPGIEGNTPGIGRNVNMTDASLLADNYGVGPCSIDFPPKFKIGGEYGIWCDFSGTTVVEINGGTLMKPTAHRKGDGKSVLAVVRSLLAVRANRAEKSQR